MPGSPDGPAVAAVLRGLKREGRDRGRGQVTGVRWEDVDAAVRIAAAHRGASLADRRDAAMVAVASDALLRVSEVAALKVPDVDPEAGTLTVRRSKTDQAGAGAVLFLGPPTVRRVRRWTAAAGLTAGPLFRRVSKAGRVGPRGLHPNSVRAIIQHRAGAAGVQGRVSGHSLRVGAAQSLAAAGAGTAEMQVAGRWKSANWPDAGRWPAIGTGAPSSGAGTSEGLRPKPYPPPSMRGAARWANGPPRRIIEGTPPPNTPRKGETAPGQAVAARPRTDPHLIIFGGGPH